MFYKGPTVIGWPFFIVVLWWMNLGSISRYSLVVLVPAGYRCYRGCGLIGFGVCVRVLCTSLAKYLIFFLLIWKFVYKLQSNVLNSYLWHQAPHILSQILNQKLLASSRSPRLHMFFLRHAKVFLSQIFFPINSS